MTDQNIYKKNRGDLIVSYNTKRHEEKILFNIDKAIDIFKMSKCCSNMYKKRCKLIRNELIRNINEALKNPDKILDKKILEIKKSSTEIEIFLNKIIIYLSNSEANEIWRLGQDDAILVELFFDRLFK